MKGCKNKVRRGKHRYKAMRTNHAFTAVSVIRHGRKKSQVYIKTANQILCSLKITHIYFCTKSKPQLSKIGN